MKFVVKLLTVAEVQVESGEDDAVDAAHARLDAFREAMLPSENYGVTLYCATPHDLDANMVTRRVEVARQPEQD